jgi:uncharacterized integral membrane protein
MATLVHAVLPLLLDALAGVVAGALVLLGVTGAQLLRKNFK